MRPESKPVISDEPDTLDESQILKCLADPDFNGRFFMSLNQPAQEKMRTVAFRHGLLNHDECAQLGIAIEDNSYGNALPERIIGEVHRRLIAGIGADDQPLAINSPFNGEKDVQPQTADKPDENAVMPVFNEKDFRLFEERIAGCDDEVFKNIVKIYILSKPNPYIGRVWNLCRTRGANVSCAIAYEILEKSWVSTRQKETIWDDLKQHAAVFEKRYGIYNIAPGVFKIPSERVQREFIELFEGFLGYYVRTFFKDRHVHPVLQGRLVDIFFAYQKGKSSWDVMEQIAELYSCKNLAPETREKINRGAYRFLDGLKEKNHTSDHSMSVAFKCEHWEVVEARIDDDNMLWRLDFIGDLLCHVRCPEDLKTKIAAKTVAKINRHYDIHVKEAYKGILLVLSHLSPAEADSAVSKIIDKLYPRERLEQNQDIVFDFRNFRGNGNYEARLAGIKLLLGMLDFVTNTDVKSTVVHLILSFGPRNDDLHVLSAKAPEFQAEIVAKENSLDEAIMRLIK